jgi:hypothetical protein
MDHHDENTYGNNHTMNSLHHDGFASQRQQQHQTSMIHDGHHQNHHHQPTHRTPLLGQYYNPKSEKGYMRSIFSRQQVRRNMYYKHHVQERWYGTLFFHV